MNSKIMIVFLCMLFISCDNKNSEVDRKLIFVDNNGFETLMSLAGASYVCGFYGRYSSDIDAPRDYQAYIDLGDMLVKQAELNIENSDELERFKKSSFENKEKLRVAVNHDIETKQDMQKNMSISFKEIGIGSCRDLIGRVNFFIDTHKIK